MNIFGKPRFWMTFIVFIISFNLVFSVDSLNIVSPSYFEEQDHVYEKINYLENELLSFEFCSDEPVDKLDFVIIPDSGKDVVIPNFESYKKKNCYFSNYELSEINSEEFALEIVYSIDLKEKIIKRKFKKQKQSKLINHVLSLDLEILNPVDLSYYLVVLNDVESAENEQSAKAYEKLKQDRNNNNKCWPRDSCSILDTSKILRNLVIAGYTHSSRLLEDGKNYLNKYKISNDNNPTRFDIVIDNSFVSGEEIMCTLKIDDEDEVNYKFDKDDDSITKYASNILNFRCNETVEMITVKEYSYTGSLKDEIDYQNSIGVNINVDAFSCIGKENNCDYSATMDTLIAYGSGIEDSKLLSSYIESLVITESDKSKSLDTNNEYEDTGKFLYYQTHKDLTDTLKFSQNNDGSWGSSSIYNDVIKTSWSIIGLKKISSDSEYIDDGKKWVYFNEPSTGWGDVEKNTVAYLSIKEQIKPYLKINAINEISESVEFVIENPTIHNLKNIRIILSSDLDEFVSYSQNLGEMDGGDKIKFKIKVDSDFYSSLTGEMTITGVDGQNNELILIDIPINLIGPTPISIVDGNYSMTPEVPFINVRILRKVPDIDLTCKYKNPFDGAENSVSLTSSDNDIEIENTGLKQGNYILELDCSDDINSFTTSGNISIQIAEKSFEIGDNITISTIDDFVISVSDLSSARQTLTFEITGNFKGLIVAAENSKLLAIDDTRDLFFRVINPVLLEAMGNSSVGDLIVKSTTGYKKIIPIYVDMNAIIEDGLMWWVWLLIVLGLGFVALVGFRFYEMKYHHGGSHDVQDVGESLDDDFYFE